MEITRDNYEERAMDFLEGNLDPGLRAEFEEFLSRNEDISAEIAVLAQGFPVAEADEIAFPDRRSLYRISRRARTGGFRRVRSLLEVAAGGAAAAAILLVLFLTVRHTAERPSEAVAVHNPSENTGNPAESTPGYDIFTAESVAAKAETAGAPAASTPGTDGISPEAHGSGKAGTASVSGGAKIAGGRSAATGVITKVTGSGTAASGAGAVKDAQTTTPEPAQTRNDILTMDVPPPLLEGEYSTIPASGSLKARNIIERGAHRIPDAPADTFRETLRQSFASIMAPLDEINPLKTYRTENTRGIEIASIRIGRNIKHDYE